MKYVEIFVEGKYEYKFGMETWIYYMTYKKAVVKRVGQIYEQPGSATRAALQALYNAIDKINQPCEVRVYSKVPLGFKFPKKSYNKDLLIKIQTAINKAGHIVYFEIDKEFSKPVIFDQVYGTSISDKIKNIKPVERTAKPSIEDKNTPNDVFSKDKTTKQKINSSRLEQYYNGSEDRYDGDRRSVWNPLSGGY